MTDPQTAVVREDELDRYIITVDGQIAGYIQTRRPSPGRITFVHTAIIPSFRGRGLASLLTGGALEDAAARGETVTPACPVVRHRLQTHPVPGLVVDWPDGAEPA